MHDPRKLLISNKAPADILLAVFRYEISWPRFSPQADCRHRPRGRPGEHRRFRRAGTLREESASVRQSAAEGAGAVCEYRTGCEGARAKGMSLLDLLGLG